MDHVDVIIIGAGISGVSSAWHLQTMCPDKSYAILEAREAIGGTWDLFRYPGIRSDSDMHTLGFRFKPWKAAKAIADGPSILSYVNETADEHGIRDKMRFGHKVTSASWSSDDAAWTLSIETAEGPRRMSCNMLLLCGGYYNYDHGHEPAFPGEDHFQGDFVRPQFWPEDLDYRGKQVVVIGSGATAMTIVPAMAMNGAGHVTMVQRSPTYVVSWPSQDRIANMLRKWLPDRLAYWLTRQKNVRGDVTFYRRTRVEPQKVKAELVGAVRQALKPEIDVETHFTPSYGPWDQRLCLIPDDDLYNVLNDGTASVVTDTIETFTEDGIRLASGEELKADIIVAATGLELKVLNGLDLTVDGAAVDVPEHWSYKGMMLSDVPNMVQTFGYINASWTLRADLTAEWACRLINRLTESGQRQATPRVLKADRPMRARPWIDDFPAGYIARSLHLLPKQGDKDPWRNTQDYAEDLKLVRYAPVDDANLEFSNPEGGSGAHGHGHGTMGEAA